MQAVSDVSVYRPEHYRIAPLWRPEVVESCINRFKMIVDPLSFDSTRASFSWRSPGVGTIMSPNVFIEASFKVTFPGRADYASLLSANYSLCGTQDVQAQGDNAVAEEWVAAYGPRIVLGSGDAFGRSLTNYQLVVNGASISNNRMNMYKQVIDRCWYSEDTFQRRFSQCGGKQDQYDSVAVSGDAFRAQTDETQIAGAPDRLHKVSAFTADSGLQTRIHNFLGITEQLPASTAVTRQDVRIVRIRWPVNGCGIFSAVGATAKDKLGVSCPYRRSAMALPHMNVISLDLLFEDMERCLFRNIGATTPGGNDNIANANVRGGIQVELLRQGNPYTQGPQLHCEYLRLGSWRGLPQSASLQCFRIAVHETTSTPVGGARVADIPADSTVGGVALPRGMPAIGVDRERNLARCAEFDVGKTVEASFQGVVSAQVPDYLAFCLQKSSKVFALSSDSRALNVSDFAYTHAAPAHATNPDAAGLQNYFRARNTDSSCAVLNISLEIQSSIGAYTYSSETFPYLRNRHELWRDQLKYVVDDYCRGDINIWFKHQCCLMLGADSFIRGLATTGTSFPITINAKVTFASARQFICGSAASAALVNTTSPAVLRDTISGTPVMLMIFPKSSLQVSPSSAILSSQNLSHSQGMDLLSRGGAQ